MFVCKGLQGGGGETNRLGGEGGGRGGSKRYWVCGVVSVGGEELGMGDLVGEIGGVEVGGAGDGGWEGLGCEDQSSSGLKVFKVLMRVIFS